jgi:hypothetical protein
MPLDGFVRSPSRTTDFLVRRLCCELLACLREGRSRKSSTNERIHWDVYPLPDFHRQNAAVARLLKRLRKEIAASSWEVEHIQPIYCINGCLVINQTSEAHREIHRWLTTFVQQ